MKSKKLFAILLALALILPGAAVSAQTMYVPLVSKGFQHQFWKAVQLGAERAGKDLGITITFEGPETEAMVDKQMDQLAAAIAKKPTAIGFAAVDSKAANPLLKKAQAAGIPIIAFDSGVDSDIPLTTCTTDNIAAAGLAADMMAKAIGNAGEVAVIVHDQTSRTGIDRRDGFLLGMKKYPNIKVVSVQYGGGDQLKSTDLAKSILQAYPNLKGFFGANEGSIIGVLNGVKEMKRNKVIVIGYDAGKQQKDAIRSGAEYGAITQDPVGMGYKTVISAFMAVKGVYLPKVTDTGFKWYDKTNIDSPDLAPLLYD
jgi:ribose transport system substrate-binding protein